MCNIGNYHVIFANSLGKAPFRLLGFLLVKNRKELVLPKIKH